MVDVPYNTNLNGRPGFSGTALFTKDEIVAVHQGAGNVNFSSEAFYESPIEESYGAREEAYIQTEIKRECNFTDDCVSALHELARNPATKVSDATCVYSFPLVPLLINMNRQACP